MVTQMNTFFPVPASNMGNGAIPTPTDPATGQTTPFTQVLTQTQAQMNPLMLALLNGMAGLSPQTEGVTAPVIPTINAEVPTETPGEQTTPTTPDANLLALAGVSMMPLVLPNAAPIVAPTPTQVMTGGNEVTPLPAQMTGTAPSVDVTAGQQTLLSGVEGIAQQGTQGETVSPGIVSAEIAPRIATAQRTNDLIVQGTASAAGQAANNPGVQQSNDSMTQQVGDGSSLVSHPISNLEMEPTLAPMIQAVVAEPGNAGQNPVKKIAVLPMDTERAIALPNLAVATPVSHNPTDSDASTDSDSHETETFAAITRPSEGTAQSAGTPTFGETMQRLEATGRTAGTTEAGKPNPTDRYEVAAQVTKHLETMTAAGGRSELIVQLKPEHLGQIKITVSTSENGLSAKIVSDSVQAQTALNGAKETLRSAFEQRGLTLETLDVTLNQQAFGNGQQAFAGMQMGHGQTHTPQMRSTARNFLPEEETEISAAAVASVPMRNSLNRLDFRA